MIAILKADCALIPTALFARKQSFIHQDIGDTVLSMSVFCDQLKINIKVSFFQAIRRKIVYIMYSS